LLFLKLLSVTTKEVLYLRIAHCINNNGQKIEIKANDNSCKKYSGRFICPNCGEQVDWIDGQVQEKHFRHHHGSYRQDCENYCKSISITRYIQPYERDGLPLYLIKEFGSYSLVLGLYGLEESSIQQAENMKLEVEIDMGENSKINRKINSQYFAPHKMNFVKINVVKQQYRLKFSEKMIPLEIKKKWILDINGIGSNGAIFYFENYGGKKVSSSNGLEVNEEYLLFTSNNMNNNHIYGVSLEMLQEINFGWLKNYRIYKFVIREINKETIGFCDKYDMHLQYSQPEVVPIWPPSTILEQELIYKGDSNKYFILNTDNKKEQDAYSHASQQKMLTDNIDDGKYLITSCVKSDDFISIGNLQNQFVFSIIKRMVTKYTTIPSIQIEINAGKVMINTNAKIFVNHFKNDILLKSSVIKKETVNELEIKNNEKVDVLYGLDIVWSMSEQLKIKVSKDHEILDIELLDKIRKCKGEFIIIPDNFKWMVLKQKKYQRAYKELQRQMKKNQVLIELINLLKKY
jgi:hypothetical protein